MPSEAVSIADLSYATHSCLIYENDEEQIAVTCEFLTRGLTRGELCVFLEKPEKVEAVRKALKENGIDVDAEEQRGALVLSSDHDYLDGGHFNNNLTLSFLKNVALDAQVKGYSALRATGDMNWELGDDQDFQTLIDYEARLDRVVRELNIVGLCQYRRHFIPGEAIRNAFETHKNIVLGRLFCTNNLFYEPSDIRLNAEPSRIPEKRAAWMYHQLAQSMRAERLKESAMRSLLHSEEKLAQANQQLEQRIIEQAHELHAAKEALDRIQSND